MIISEIKKITKGIVLEDEPMSEHTSYGIGGKVLAYIRPYDRPDLIRIIKLINKHKAKLYFVGSGSNLLVNDKNIRSFVITPAKALKSLNIDKNIIIAESGVMLGKIVKKAVTHRLTGLETLVGVPGTLGGALIMNAGAFGSEISEHHANFFINHGNAKAADIASLIRLSRKTIYEKFGIMLELEIKTIGFNKSELYPYAN